MAATFVVEDGTIVAGANAYCTEAFADQYHENHGNPTAWSGAAQADKEDAIRQATRYLDLNFEWVGRRVSSEQVLDWPRSYVEDKNGFAIAADEIPTQIQEACAYLALVSLSEELIPDQEIESSIKRQKLVIGPIAEDVEYVGGESSDTRFTIAEKLVAEFIETSMLGNVELERS